MPISDIFTTVLLDHYRRPRCQGTLDDPDVTLEGANPLCGDEIEIQVKTEGDKIEQIAFTGKSCAICTASTSMFCEHAVGCPIDELGDLKGIVQKMLHGETLSREERHKLGDILALEGVSKLPVRVKCALLVYETWALIAKQLRK